MGNGKNNTPTKKNPYFGNYDLYSDANPKDTIRIKYDTVENTKKTIKKLEGLRKSGKYTHVRIVQVTNVMTQRLRVIYNKTGKGKTRYDLSKKYFEKLKKETKKKNKSTKKSPKRKNKSQRRKSTKKSPKHKNKSQRRKSTKKSPKRKNKSQRRKSTKKSPKRKTKSQRRKSRKKSPKRKTKSQRIKSYNKKSAIEGTKYCVINCRLSDKTINQMRKLCEEPEENGEHNEKASSMSAIKGESDNIYTIEINNNAMIKGDEVGVDIVPGLYNFHTHPRNAYKIYNVKLGWPSGQDYIGFLLSFVEDDTIFHVVASLEGVYIISIHKDWIFNKKFTQEIGDFISKNYTFSYKEGDTINGYLNKINNINYNDSDRIFIVKFFPWEKADSVFRISYAKTYDKCFTCEKEKKKYENKMNTGLVI